MSNSDSYHDHRHTIRRRRRSPDPEMLAQRFGIMEMDAIYNRSDVCATEQIPALTRVFDHVFDARGAEAPRIDVTRVSEQGADSRWQVSIKSPGRVELAVPTVQSAEMLRPTDLHEVADRPLPEAYRPNWLDVSYAPRIRPHMLDYLRIASPPMHLMIGESLSFSYPWCTIGKLFVFRPGQKTKEGSGVLVGPNLLLTSSHGMPWDNREASIRFVPAYRDGNGDERFGEAWVERYRGVPRGEGEADEHDFVICKLDWRIGDRTGWMGSQAWSTEPPYYARSWMSVGFPAAFMGGQVPAVEAPVSVEDIDAGGDYIEIETHSFTSGGWSGGPLWGWINDDPRVIGVCSGTEKDFLDPTRSVFAGGIRLVGLVKHGWANWQ